MDNVIPIATALTLDPSQELAVELMKSASFGIVTGGPGTGKSTCTRIALDALDKMGISYRLAAPTGKAARRLHETTGRHASTIHRLLQWRGGTFEYNRFNPIPTQVVIVDEASMIDVQLAAALFGAIDETQTRLILIGDADQLPPVGPGRVFGDLVEAGIVPTARLNTLHRSALESWIHVNAQHILRGEKIDLEEKKDFRYYNVEESADVVGCIVDIVARIIPMEIDADAQVLIPQNPGPAGIIKANAALQDALNPRIDDSPFLKRGKENMIELRINDRVIQTRNDYQLDSGRGVFNGEIGNIVDIEKGNVSVQFSDRAQPVSYTLEQSGALQLAYALTVHRFQGSEVPWVVAVCHGTHSYILNRQLIYTAITRGKKGVILVGNKTGISVALGDKRPPRRNTDLVARASAAA